MGLFDKCYEFEKKLEYVKAQDQFFYFRQFDPPGTPVVTMKGRKLIMLGSNNYLGLSNHPKVVEAAIKAVKEYGTGACSSRILTGTTTLHAKLEEKLAEFKGTEDAVVFSTGFMTMMGTIAALTREGDSILSDELNHASIVDGCRLSKAQVRIYRHNNMESLEQELSKCEPSANKLIVTDGVFSMRGTVANLPEIKRLADRFGAAIMLDDAHGTGVLGAKGRGTLEHFDMEGQIELVCGTFSKSFATVGGFTGAKREVVSFLRLNSRPFVFTASPPPVVVATVLAGIEVIEQEPELLQNLRRNADFMKRGLRENGFTLDETVTPIIPVLVGDEQRAFKMTARLQEEGLVVNPIIPPAVPPGGSLIRVSIMAAHTVDQLSTALDKFRSVGKELGIL
jgi:8-amino-7-oxononanoate synthase